MGFTPLELASAVRGLMPFFQKLPLSQPKLWKTGKVKVTQLNYSWKMKETCHLPKESGTTTLLYQGNASQLKEICGWGHSWSFALKLAQTMQV